MKKFVRTRKTRIGMNQEKREKKKTKTNYEALSTSMSEPSPKCPHNSPKCPHESPKCPTNPHDRQTSPKRRDQKQTEIGRDRERGRHTTQIRQMPISQHGSAQRHSVTASKTDSHDGQDRQTISEMEMVEIESNDVSPTDSLQGAITRGWPQIIAFRTHKQYFFFKTRKR